MRQVRYSTKAKKDLKKYRDNETCMRRLYEVLDYLIHDYPLPARYFPHKLTGQYKGCWECHVGSDFLLIWIDAANEVIEIIRIGSHAELFG